MKKIFWYILVIAIIILGFYFLFIWEKEKPKEQEETEIVNIPVSEPKEEGEGEKIEEKEEEKVNLTINSGKEEKKYEVTVEGETTVFELLKKASKDFDFDLQYKESSIGVMIEKIGEEKNGVGGKYWLFFVNGKVAQVAVDKQKVKANDKVEFKYEEVAATM